MPTETATFPTSQSSPLAHGPVLPVVVLERASDAIPVARALIAGGITAIEITLRTPVALEAIRILVEDMPAMSTGAGSVRTPREVEYAVTAGAQFLVSPGASRELLKSLVEAPCAVLPGTATVTEAIAVAEAGLDEMKFFPAEASGGVSYLGSLAPVLPGLRFCPTGGVRPSNARDYLDLPSVTCVGGTWLTPRQAVDSSDWAHIESLARAASQLSAAGSSTPVL